MAAAAEQQYIVFSQSVLGLFGDIGPAVGLTIFAAIWQAILPSKLSADLPDTDQADLLLIYDFLPTQLTFLPGTTERPAIQHAYSDTQRGMLIASTVISALGLAAVVLWRDIKVIGIRQTKDQAA
ncbi:hypothetical protein BPOR_0093g00090 [Botrytis porri]|uniref:Major facilitator superfamily (MFS) profile domain-containing protein n=1 Tax=Botrytis porri TaxID=87229 RepID=A0A4Z1KZ51_9HELO|nr:hypothetical protein BPOR_0093g00090 [Botrytis porri]